jgi:hypothetical protein
MRVPKSKMDAGISHETRVVDALVCAELSQGLTEFPRRSLLAAAFVLSKTNQQNVCF